VMIVGGELFWMDCCYSAFLNVRFKPLLTFSLVMHDANLQTCFFVSYEIFCFFFPA